MTEIPNFNSQVERTQWIIDNATEFSLVRRANRHNYRVSIPNLKEAIGTARGLVKIYPSARLLVYAVHGPLDTWVATVTKDGVYTGHGDEKPWKIKKQELPDATVQRTHHAKKRPRNI